MAEKRGKNPQNVEIKKSKPTCASIHYTTARSQVLHNVHEILSPNKRQDGRMISYGP
jgi:hypothetical protein